MLGLPPQAAPSTEAQQPVSVEGPLFDLTFTEVGARLLSAQLVQFPSFTFTGPCSSSIREAWERLGNRILLVGQDTLDLRHIRFQAEPRSGLHLQAGQEPQTLRFIYRHPTQPFTYEVDYTFSPDHYVVDVQVGLPAWMRSSSSPIWARGSRSTSRGTETKSGPPHSS